MSDVVNSNVIESREGDVKAALNALINSLDSYKNELAQQERKLQESRALMLDQLSDANAATVLRNLSKRLEEKDNQLTESKRKCAELEEKLRLNENDLRSKSRHIEKLSSLLLCKEEKIEELKTENRSSAAKISRLEELVETKEVAVEKWRSAAHQAAEKMREQLSTLKASEEMNQDLRDLLDKQISKLPQKSVEKTSPASELLTEEELQELVTKFTTPQTTAFTISLPQQRKILTPVYRASSPRFLEETHSAISQPAESTTRSLVSTRASSPLYLHPVTSGTTSDDVRTDETSLTSSPIVFGTNNDEDAGESGLAPRVRFQLDDNNEHSYTQRLDVGGVRYPAPVPNFSKLVGDALQSGQIHDPVLWKYFIRECVHFYYDLMPTTETAARNSFYIIGRTLHEKFPCIAKEGPSFKTPWTYFNTCLSSRLRHERFARKRVHEKRVTPLLIGDDQEPKRSRLDEMDSPSWREGGDV